MPKTIGWIKIFMSLSLYIATVRSNDNEMISPCTINQYIRLPILSSFKGIWERCLYEQGLSYENKNEDDDSQVKFYNSNNLQGCVNTFWNVLPSVSLSHLGSYHSILINTCLNVKIKQNVFEKNQRYGAKISSLGSYPLDDFTTHLYGVNDILSFYDFSSSFKAQEGFKVCGVLGQASKPGQEYILSKLDLNEAKKQWFKSIQTFEWLKEILDKILDHTWRTDLANAVKRSDQRKLEPFCAIDENDHSTNMFYILQICSSGKGAAYDVNWLMTNFLFHIELIRYPNGLPPVFYHVTSSVLLACVISLPLFYMFMIYKAPVRFFSNERQ